MALWSEDECRDFESGALFFIHLSLLEMKRNDSITLSMYSLQSCVLIQFLSGLRVYGKDFRQIQKNKVQVKRSTANRQLSILEDSL